MSFNSTAGQMTVLLLSTGHVLSDWLQDKLSKLQEDWWDQLVLNNLSHHQIRDVESRGLTRLQNLDLAALLRLLDRNWYPISQNLQFTATDRNIAKEMQTVRNRWAHIEATGIPQDDIYRDVDTLHRFLRILKADEELVDKAKELKSSIISDKSAKQDGESKELTPITVKSESIINPQSGEIQIGDIIKLKSDASQQGAVIQIIGTGDSTQYAVFMENKKRLFYASQVLPVDDLADRRTVAIRELHTLLTSFHVNHPSLSTLYSLNAARIDFVPYQFRPALKLLRSDQPRILIADSVGVGKTIEAGLILRELQARRDIESVLIICPKPLVAERKWEIEMKRFDERFTHLDGGLLQHCVADTELEGEWPDQYSKAIIPYSLLDKKLLHGVNEGTRQRVGLLDLDPPPHFDLVIVDEAHHIKNASTERHQAVRYFCENAEAVVFMTATPVQLGNQDLFTLLNTLRPDLVIDEETFAHMAEPNPHINEALRQTRSGKEDWQEMAGEALMSASRTDWGRSLLVSNPEFQAVSKSLAENQLKQDERLAIARKIESFHSFSQLINRTRRRDIEDFCIRKPETVECPFTEEQAALHDRLLEFETETLAMIHGDQNVNFMMTTIRRQAASCIFGLAPFIRDILERRLSHLAWLETTDEEIVEVIPDRFMQSLKEKAEEITAMARTLPPIDPKLDAFCKIIQDKNNLPNNKIMVFSSFRHTLKYLKNKLDELGFRAGLVHGDVADEDRRLLRERFEKPKEDENALDVMLFSEVGCEGLDYQFCDAMINYDLPWNPMRIEQRIGRIDRRGQKSEAVVIYNLITPGTVDATIYERCLLRIGVFQESLGDCEEILGEITQEIHTIGESFDLTEEEKAEKLDQLSDNKVRKIQEQAELEDREHELFGVRLPQSQTNDDIRQAENYWLTPHSIQFLIEQYIAKRCGEGEYILGDKLLKTLRLSQESRQLLLEDFRKLLPHKQQKNPVYRSWEQWLKGTDQHCAVTFDSTCASDRRDAHFIYPLHPVVKQAADCLEAVEPVYTAFKIYTEDVPKGDYPFSIYAWEYKGIREDLRLVPVFENQELCDHYFDYLESGSPLPAPESSLFEDEQFASLNKIHHALWESEKEIHQQKEQKTCAFRRESMDTSHRGRMNVLHEQLDNSTNDKIRRMKQAQIANAIRDYEQQKARIEDAENSFDIHARAIVFGVLRVEGEADAN